MSEEKIWQALVGCCHVAGLDVAPIPGAMDPEMVAERLRARISALQESARQYTSLTQRLQELAPLVGGEALTAVEVIEQLPAYLELARHGVAYLAHQREEALRWYDRAYADPTSERLSDVQRRQRERIAQSSDLQYLSDVIAECRARAEERFGASERRSSISEDLPVEHTRVDTAEIRRIDAQLRRWGMMEG